MQKLTKVDETRSRFVIRGIAILFVALTACAPDSGNVRSDDEFAIAANSWLGADIKEMLAVWPNPNMRCGPNEIGQAGCAWWRLTNRRNLGVSSDSWTYNYYCEAIVKYDAAGSIIDIDVVRSINCERRFSRGFGLLTRRPAEDSL